MSSPVKTCVLGVGLAGLAFHVPFILALPEVFTLYAVLERNPTSEGGKVKERFGATVKIHRSLEDVLADPEIELIIVGTPNETHYAFAKAALEAGKNVLVDKPITSNFKEAQELGALAKSKGLVIFPFQNRRYDSDYLALRSLLSLPKSSPESLGDLVEFESHFDRYRASLKGTWKDEPKPAAGQTFDLGAHLIDQALTLFGRPKSVTAFIENIRGVGNPAVDDSFTITLRYPAGAVSPHPFTAILRAHILSVRTSQPRFIVRGTKGTYLKYGLDRQEDRLRVMPKAESIFEADFGAEPESMWGELHSLREDGSVVKSTWPSKEPGAYVNLFKNLAATIRGTAEQEVKWEQSAGAIEVIELAHKSSKEGRTIELS
ncbi:NAD-P-binding protein [Stereum hirsutum FP-91666 SS1]|uniref:NAD-P-binding protein n=1 Tax=Stereum hirsutum (strain FP-91666) TaxID=721885 RepID=UPI000440BBDD|nr:NAD-P-binding protein [Stereum hirsutum FP-91666 SS1]EIM88136.1 NAD-P-binding protein [Stereum hirsutum FP-91666 SS1]